MEVLLSIAVIFVIATISRVKRRLGDAGADPVYGPYDMERRNVCVGIKKHVILNNAGSKTTI